MKKLLIICTGNTCRSPMAGALAEAWFKQTGDLGVEIKTAGLSAYPEAPASEQGITVMAEKGLDLTRHKAKQLTEELVDWADIILTMTWSHKQKLLALYSNAAGKTYTLGEYSAGFAAGAELNTLSEEISKKEQGFILAHGEDLDMLISRQQQLKQELLQIEKELDKWQRKFEEEVKEERKKLMLLEKEIIALDITDPFGGSVEIYRQTAEMLEDLLPEALTRFQKKEGE